MMNSQDSTNRDPETIVIDPIAAVMTNDELFRALDAITRAVNCASEVWGCHDLKPMIASMNAIADEIQIRAKMWRSAPPATQPS